MADALGRFRRKAFERPGVKAAYDALADEFAFLDEVLRARAEAGLTQAEVAARVTERQFYHLAAPVLRITGADIPFPAPLLEKYYLPHPERILTAMSTWEWDI